MNNPQQVQRAVAIGAALLLVLGAAPSLYQAWRVHTVVSQNIEARGGQAAWDSLQAVRFTGTLDLGHAKVAPFRLEQARPSQSCFSYEFQGGEVIQCTTEALGWKQAAFTGDPAPQRIQGEELREASAGADPRGLLIDYGERGHDLHFDGAVDLEGRPAWKLTVTLPQGAVRTVYLDQETGLELQVSSQRRLLGKELRVDTVYSDWAETEGLLFPRRQASRTEGDEAWHALEIQTLQVNPPLDAARFSPPPGLAGAGT
jgi:hypothetical protein